MGNYSMRGSSIGGLSHGRLFHRMLFHRRFDSEHHPGRLYVGAVAAKRTPESSSSQLNKLNLILTSLIILRIPRLE